MSSNSKSVGRVVGLWRYPVKSMGAEALKEVEISWFGLAGDRRWAFVKKPASRSDFPWATIRQRNDMMRFLPSLDDPADPDASSVTVATPSGQEMDILDPRLAEEIFPQGATAIKQNRGVFDTFPLSLITTQTITNLGESVGRNLDVQRFRPNLLVEAAEDQPFLEDSWVGRVLTIGNFRMRVDKRDGRCMVVTVDPITTERHPEVLRAIVNDRDGCLGVYGSSVEPGNVSVNDEVMID